MGVLIADKQIDRIWVVDDNEGSRAGTLEFLGDSGFDSLAQEDQVFDVNHFIANAFGPADAVISDHQLTVSNFFPINGAEFVAKCFDKNIPSILVTRYDKAQMSEIRKYRSKIPVLINPAHLDSELIPPSFEICIKERKGVVRKDRKLHRTLIRVDSIELPHVYIIIPGWDSREIIPIHVDEITNEDVRQALQADKKVHVKANIGCESLNDLYFADWESK
jgi:hypothetical protein